MRPSHFLQSSGRTRPVVLNQPPGVQVRLPIAQRRALHICHYPVEAPRPWERAIWLPAPLTDDIGPGAIRDHLLLLPGPGKGMTWPILPPEIDPTLTGLWVDMEGIPLSIPLLADQWYRFEQNWRTKTVFTPWSVGHPFGEKVHATVGWAVLARIPRHQLIGALALMSCVFECQGADPRFLETYVRLMDLPPLYRNKLLGAARGGQPVLDPKSLRWILTEIAAADEAELRQRATWRPAPGSDEELLVRAVMPILLTDSPAGWSHLRTALWLLGDSFHGAERPFSTSEDILAGVTALGCATAQTGGWLPTLERWTDIWSIPDNHRAVQSSTAPPSAMRAAYGAALGIDPVQWLAGISFIGLRWWMSFQPGALAQGMTLPTSLDQVLRFQLGSDAIQLSAEFGNAWRTHLVTGVEQFADDIRSRAGNYAGLGSLPQTDSLACRNHPILEMPDGVLVPISLNLMAERSSVLHRWLLNTHGARQVNGPVGYMFEAYVDDLVSTKAGASHRVLSEAEITAVLGDSCRCDLAVVNGTDWLFIETSLQTIARTVATGQAGGIDELCRRYHNEADQAEETARRADELAKVYGLAKPSSTTYIVVVDNSAPHSPALMARMHELRPGRNPRFVVSADELDALARLGELGWSMPGAVQRWRSQPQEGPISTVSAELARLIRPKTGPNRDEWERWRTLLPTDEPPTAEPPKAA